MNADSGFQLGDLRGAVRRRAKVAALIVLVVVLGAYWLAMALPNEYQSYATILVEPQSVSRDLVAANVGEINLTERLGLMAAQVLSRPRLSGIIDKLNLYEDESRTLLRQDLIDRMRAAVRIEPIVPELEERSRRTRRDSEINTFRIFFTHENPVTAAAVAQELANNFIDRHIKARIEQSQKSLDFMETELERLATDIRAIEARVAEVKAANPGRLPSDQAANHTRIDRFNAELASAQRALSEARSDEAFYRTQAAAAATLAPANDTTSPARRLRLLELLLSEYEARGFTEKHPDVKKAQLEIEAITAQIKASAEDEEEDDASSFAKQSVDAELRRAEQQRIAAEEEIARIEEAIAGVQTRLAEAPRVAEQLEALEREYRHLFGSYQDFSNRRQEATVSAQLERRQLGEQFRVLESAFRATAPSSPDRLLIVGLGAFFALVLAVAAAVLLEAADGSLHSARQLQSSASVPVLGAIPRIWLDYDRAARRRSHIRTALATAMLVVFALVGGFANYRWVNGRPAGAQVEVPAEGAGEPAAPAGPTVPAPSAEPGAPGDPFGGPAAGG